MTEELAQVDAYLAETSAVVSEVDDGAIVLDRTVFYPTGGGQPGDTGVVDWTAGSARITDTVRRGGRVLHMAEGVDLPAPGAEVSARIDWERRHLLMRTHTALHVLSAIMWRDFGAKVTGGNMEPGSARMDFELEGITVELGRLVQERVNAVLEEGHPVVVRFMPRAEALADPDLIRTKVNLIPEHIEKIRVIEIGLVDKQADGGTHVANTSEVGTVRVVKTESKGAGNKRMRIEVGS